MNGTPKPTPDDFDEAVKFSNELVGADKPDNVSTGKDPCNNQENAEWLRTGKKSQAN